MKSPAFSFYVRDWLCSKTVSKLHSKGISKGVGAYVYLLSECWLEEPRATLPTDENDLAQLARVTVEELRVIWPYIKEQFPLDNTINRYFNERLLKQSNIQLVRAKAGAKGAAKGAANHSAKGAATLEDANANEIGNYSSYAEAEIPSWKEFWDYCQSVHCGLAAEFYAKDKWEAANADHWQKKSDWRAYARRCKGWWEADGKPMTNKKNYGNNPQKVNTRNLGTGIDAAEVGRKTAEVIARRARESAAAQNGVAAKVDQP